MCVMSCERALLPDLARPSLAQQNLGAAIRGAYFLGAAGVLCCGRNSAPLSPAVSKASAGALEYLPIHACRSMPRTLARAAAQGWAVLGARASLAHTGVFSPPFFSAHPPVALSARQHCLRPLQDTWLVPG
jgi:hypothetical protein